MNAVITAINQRDEKALKDALADGGDPNSRDYLGHPALLLATSSDQFRVANALVGKGADIWFTDEFGITPGGMAAIARLKQGSEEAKARDQFVAELRERGYPWPPPDADTIMTMHQRGTWPPPLAAKAH